MPSLEVRYLKNGDCITRNLELCILEEYSAAKQETQLGLTDSYDMNECYSQSEGVSQQISGGDLCQQVSRVDLSKQISGGDLSQHVSWGDLSQLVSRGDLSQQISGGDLSQQVSGGDLSQQVSRGDLSQQISGGDLSQQVSRGDLSQQVSGGDLSQQVSRGDLSQQRDGSINLGLNSHPPEVEIIGKVDIKISCDSHTLKDITEKQGSNSAVENERTNISSVDNRTNQIIKDKIGNKIIYQNEMSGQEDAGNSDKFLHKGNNSRNVICQGDESMHSSSSCFLYNRDNNSVVNLKHIEVETIVGSNTTLSLSNSLHDKSDNHTFSLQKHIHNNVSDEDSLRPCVHGSLRADQPSDNEYDSFTVEHIDNECFRTMKQASCYYNSAKTIQNSVINGSSVKAITVPCLIFDIDGVKTMQESSVKSVQCLEIFDSFKSTQQLTSDLIVEQNAHGSHVSSGQIAQCSHDCCDEIVQCSHDSSDKTEQCSHDSSEKTVQCSHDCCDEIAQCLHNGTDEAVHCSHDCNVNVISSKDDINTRSTTRKLLFDFSDIDPHVKSNLPLTNKQGSITFDNSKDTYPQEQNSYKENKQNENDILHQSTTSKFVAKKVVKSPSHQPDCEEMTEKSSNSPQMVDINSTLVDKISRKQESPLKTALVSNTNNEDTVHPSPKTVIHQKKFNNATLEEINVKKNKNLLKILKQNGVKNFQQSNLSPNESPCKVITKYVFINQSSKQKSGKKRFGILYRQAFKNYYQAKLKKKNKKAVIRKKRTKMKSRVKTKQNLVKKGYFADFFVEDSPQRKSGREERNKSREERRLAREIKKNISEDLSEKMKHKKMPNRGNKKKEERKRCKKNKTKKIETKERKTKPKGGEMKLSKTDGKEKVDGTSGTEDLNEVSNFTITKIKVSKKVNKKISKTRKEEIVKEESCIQYGSKRNRKLNNFLYKPEVAIKEEINEEDVDEEKHIENEESVCSWQEKSKTRNRKDLTLEQKVQAIKLLELQGSKLVAVAKKFGVSVSAISRINKNKEHILLRSVSGELNSTQRRSRECKDPELDKVLLRWYRAVEQSYSYENPVIISNIFLKEKAHSLAMIMGKSYFPSDNWIIRWKNRHNIRVKSHDMSVVVQDREEFQQLDSKVNISEILEDLGKPEFKIDQFKQEGFPHLGQKPDELFICEHCGILTSKRKKKENNHLIGCPASSVRKDLTLEEKVQVVRALEQPGMKMVTLAKKYGVSASAISRINKNRVDILARRASGLSNAARRRDRGSKEPEVEKMLCEWFKAQHELGIHLSGAMIREKAREIARVLGKDFWPSESWVFRWRHRNNVTDVNSFLYGDEDGAQTGLERNNYNVDEVTFVNSTKDGSIDKISEVEEDIFFEDCEKKENKKQRDREFSNERPIAKQLRLPRMVMCEKCGFVSSRVKNNRIKSLRHAKGCPDLKPRNELTYENRARMLKALEEPGATLSSVARQFGVSVSSMSRMNQKKDQILSHSEDHASQKRIRDCKEPTVAHKLYQWYMEKKAQGIHVTGPQLKEKSKKFAAELGREFNASSGWLGRWRHRYNVLNNMKTTNKPSQESATRRRSRKSIENRIDSSEQFVQLEAISPELQQESLGSSGSVIIESLDPAPPVSQTAPVFIHQRFQNPWEMSHQAAESCLWTKEFLTPIVSNVLDDAASVSVAYTYGDTVSKPVFQNLFDSFSAVGYQVSMPLDSGMGGNREYLKPDTDDKCGNPLSHLPSLTSHIPLSQHPHHLSTPQQHLQHHITVTHPHSVTHTQIQPHQQIVHSHPVPSPAGLEDDPEQQRQVLEAFKIMSSFAQKKSLGDQVQAALRTIEISMNTSTGKPSTRQPYTSM